MTVLGHRLTTFTHTPVSMAPLLWTREGNLSTLFQSGTRGSEGSAVAADADPIGLIHDQSGGNRDLTQGTSGNRPLVDITSGVTSIEFDGTDDFLINNSPGVTDYPFSMGFWFNANSLIFKNLGGLLDTSGSGTHRFAANLTGTGQVSIEARTGSSTTVSTTGTISAGTWNYGVWRFINSTNRRLSVLFSTGTIEHIQSTGSSAPAGLDQIRIGAGITAGGAVLDPFVGKMRRIWYKNTDIQSGGGQLDDNTLLRLAYGGVTL